MRILTCSIALTLLSCGYSFHGAPRRVRVEPIQEHGPDLDAAVEVSAAVRRAIARGPSTVLVERAADLTLELTLAGATSVPSPFSDSSRRAAESTERIRIRATLTSTSGRVVFQGDELLGEADYVSPPGEIATIEGARRTALARAAERLAQQLAAKIRQAR
ncbi:MAG: hypothetical protein HY791_07225 [Deltaproteobacteria bacterium]|nr:hypothetical protein [Deltaproteobacteria bacterium]